MKDLAELRESSPDVPMVSTLDLTEVGISQFEAIMSAKSVVNVMFCPSNATRMLSL